MENYYDILGLSKDASQDDIKQIYRKLSLQYHPDRNKSAGASEMFKKINEANQVLGDKQKRRSYDMQMQFGGMFGGSNQMDMGNLDDLLNSFLGGGMGGFPFPFPGGSMSADMDGGPEIHIFSSGNMPNMFQGGVNIPNMFQSSEIFQNMMKVPLIEKIVNITLKESYYGGTMKIEVEKWTLMNNRKIKEQAILDVVITKGIYDGEEIELKRQGNKISENQIGDVKIIVNIDEEDDYSRDGLDLIYKKKITLKEALCGFSFIIKHISDKELKFNNTNKKLLIKPGFRKVINDLGFKRNNDVGNMIIEFEVEFPEELSSEQLENLEKIL
tara:strand:+ start:19790 stop:20773 length:984 start_codon:yes stop_codon:yes gene_type:complete